MLRPWNLTGAAAILPRSSHQVRLKRLTSSPVPRTSSANAPDRVRRPHERQLGKTVSMTRFRAGDGGRRSNHLLANVAVDQHGRAAMFRGGCDQRQAKTSLADVDCPQDDHAGLGRGSGQALRPTPPPSTVPCRGTARKAASTTSKRHDMTARELPVVDVVARLLQARRNAASAAPDRQDRVLPAVRHKDAGRVRCPGWRRETWRESKDVAEQPTVRQSERDRIRGAVREAGDRDLPRIDVDPGEEGLERVVEEGDVWSVLPLDHVPDRTSRVLEQGSPRRVAPRIRRPSAPRRTRSRRRHAA